MTPTDDSGLKPFSRFSLSDPCFLYDQDYNIPQRVMVFEAAVEP